MTTEEDKAAWVESIAPNECCYKEFPDGPLCRKPAKYRIEVGVGAVFRIGPDEVGRAEDFVPVTMGVCEEHRGLLDNPVAYSIGGDVAKGKDRS